MITVYRRVNLSSYFMSTTMSVSTSYFYNKGRLLVIVGVYYWCVEFSSLWWRKCTWQLAVSSCQQLSLVQMFEIFYGMMEILLWLIKSRFRSANDTFEIFFKKILHCFHFCLSSGNPLISSTFSSTNISFMRAQLDRPTQCFILLNLQNVTHCQSRRVIYVCNEMLTFEHR